MIFKWIHALSLDVVLGALSVGLFVIHVLNVSPPLCWWSVLATAVWSVYTADHLLDGAGGGVDSQMFRHQLHYKERKILIIFLILSGSYALICSLFCFDLPIITGGIMLGVFVVFYLVFTFVARKYNFYFQKEFFVSLVYVSGIWFAPLIWYGVSPPPVILVIFIIFFLFGWIDGLMIASLDRQRDLQDHQISFATYYGNRATDYFIITLLVLSALLLVLGFVMGRNDNFRGAFMLLLLIDVAFVVLFSQRKRLYEKPFYRFFLEMIFWIPAGIILCY